MQLNALADKPETAWSDIELVRPNRLCRELVFADGIGSSGKGMLSHILASFERVEKQSNHTPFDYVAYLHWLGKMSDDAATLYLQTEADQQLYHIMMSRDVNFRPFDSTGVLQNPRRFEYLKRIFMKEGDSVVERIRRQRPILNEAPHDALRNAPLFFRAFGRSLRIVFIVRNPLEIVLDWDRRGFGTRIGVDPREFQFSFIKNGRAVPLFMLDSSLDYHSMNDTERNVVMIDFCLRHNRKGYASLCEEFRQFVKIISFDDLATDPQGVCQGIARFIGSKVTGATKRTLRKERLPRPLTDKAGLAEVVKSKCSQNVWGLVDSLLDKHEQLVAHAKVDAGN